MKNRILTTIIGIIFSMFLVIVFTIPTYAVGNVEANVILEKDVNVDNKIQVSLETSQNQSIASFNISLLVETVNMQDIKSVKIDWNSDISNNAELKELTYSNNKINIYVVSKNELGNNDGNQRKINIGTISIETENKDSMNVVIRAHKDLTRIASIGHEAGVITNDISREEIDKIVIKDKIENAGFKEEEINNIYDIIEKMKEYGENEIIDIQSSYGEEIEKMLISLIE